MKPLLIGAMLAASIVGCAVVETGGNTWFKEGATAQEREAALGAARVQAAQAHVTPQEARGMVIRSMTAQGWRLMPKVSAPPLKSDTGRKAPIPMRTGTASGL